MDVGNLGIQAAMHCERVISLLNHIRKNHKDVSALIRLQRHLIVRRKALYRIKMYEPLMYHQILRVYNLEDIDSPKGQGIHRHYFHCKRKRYVQ